MFSHLLAQLTCFTARWCSFFSITVRLILSSHTDFVCICIYLYFCNTSALFLSTHEGSQKCVWKLLGKHQVLTRYFYWILTVSSVRLVYLLNFIFWHFSDEAICSLEKFNGLVGNGAKVQTQANCRAQPLRRGGSLIQPSSLLIAESE